MLVIAYAHGVRHGLGMIDPRLFRAVVGLALLTLTGCVTPEQQAAIQAQNETQDDSYCRSLSAHPGSDAYVNCRLVQQQQRQNTAVIDQQRRAAFGQAMNQALNPPQQPPVFRQPVTCNSQTYGRVTNTNCY